MKWSMSLTNYSSRHIIHPGTRVEADGWHSDVITLQRSGWLIEVEYAVDMMATVFYMRNPSKHMVGRCYIDDGHIQRMYGSNSPIAYMDQSVLLKADMYKELMVPKMDLQQVEVGEPMMDPAYHYGRDIEWMIYTADNNATDIIVTPESVPRLLEEIRKAQMPRAKEILHSQRKREAPEIQTMAKILAFG